MLHPVLLFVPLDDRPVSCEAVVELAAAAGAEVRMPDRALLGDRDRPGEAAEIRRWLAGAVAAGADALIASVEMLCFGGLVASRRSTAEFAEVAPALGQVLELAAQLPAYLSAVVPRTPVVATGEDPAYWAAYGEALRPAAGALDLQVARRPGDALEAALAAAELPDEVRQVVRRHRLRHLRLNLTLIDAAARGALRCLLIGQDDTAPGSLSQLERAVLQAECDRRRAGTVQLTSGADELNLRLLARWLNDRTGRRPGVQVVYTFPWNADAVPLYEARPLASTVAEHIAGAGCAAVPDDPRIVLWVHNFEQQQGEAASQAEDPSVLDAAGPVVRTLRAAAREERVVALADVRFANGADRALVGRLLEERRFAGIVAYAGWNTCSNALGSALAQAVVAAHLRAGDLAGDDGLYRTAVFRRILDDWGYQSFTRQALRAALTEQGADPANLGAHEAAAERQALSSLRDDVLPSLRRSFPYHPVHIQQVTFPWHRLFEIRLVLELPRAPRAPEPIALVEPDPAWPLRYEEARTAIAGALGPLVRGIEHIGSTAVPALPAKPILDILLGVHADDLDRLIEPLAALGFDYDPEWEISLPLRRYFHRAAAGGAPACHLHAVPHGGEFWRRHLAFRDYLRAHPEVAREYGALKRRLAGEHGDRRDYTLAKTAFIRSVEARAGVAPRP